MSNQRGFITVDFIFSIVLIFGMMAILFVFTLTLTVASITQYVTFATARNYVAGHLDLASQETQATTKYSQLISNPTFAPFFKNSWFKISGQPDLGDISQIIQGYQSGGPGDPNLFWGAGTTFTAMILDFTIPGFGPTTTSGDPSGKEFNTYMGSYLGREVTVDECMKLLNARWGAIQALPATNGASYSSAPNAPIVFADNGC